jgi:hypothetical protein
MKKKFTLPIFFLADGTCWNSITFWEKAIGKKKTRKKNSPIRRLDSLVSR